MRHWKTNDWPTKTNLDYLDSLSKPHPGIDRSDLANRIHYAAKTIEMLPASMRQLISVPRHLVGAATAYWSDARLVEEAELFSDALAENLDRVESEFFEGPEDPVDPRERPATKGEEIVDAIRAYERFPGQSELSRLRLLIAGTSLQSRMNKFERLLSRKRRSPGGQSLEYERVSALADIRRYVDECHHLPASEAFQSKRDQPQ